MRKNLLLAAVLCPCILCADTAIIETYLSPALIRTSGTPDGIVGSGLFYGYRKWNEGPGDFAFRQAKALAESEGVPLILVWSNEGCGHCAGFASNLNGSDELVGWMKSRRAVFAYFKGEGGTQHPMAEHGPQACKEAYDFTVDCGAPAGRKPWPFYAFYYRAPDGTHMQAGSLAGQVQSTYSAASASAFMSMVDAFIDEYADVPVPGDAAFLNANTPEARLEAMPSTAAVHVPIIKSAHLDQQTENTLTATYPDGTKITSNVVWRVANGEPVLLQEVRIPVASGWRADGVIRLQLRDARGVLNAESAITCVAEVANRQRFPYKPGEKTEAELAWGEWTMDLDVATNKVRMAVEDKAYTLVAVGGALWCPNCTNCEEYVYNDPKFTQWAEANHVALVMYDQPNNGKTSPTLLTHDVGTNGRSGSYYLSRKGMTLAEAQAQYDRVYALSHTRWPEGWLIEPTAGRISNPVIIVVRRDGTPAGRLSFQRVRTGGSTSTEPYDIDENLARLTELLALADDTSAHGLTEETNGKAGTTPLSHAFGSTSAFKLQVNDRSDVFRLTGLPAGKPVRFDVSAPAGTKSPVVVSVLRGVSGAGSAMTTAALPTVASNTWVFTEQQLADGVYLELSAFSAIVERIGTTDIPEYRYAVYGGDTAFSATVTSREVPPDPGTVGFTAAGSEVVEGRDPFATLEVVRARGASGSVGVRIVRIDDPAITTADPAKYVWDPADTEAHTFRWNETELGTRSLKVPIIDDEIHDGTQTVGFELKVVDGKGVEMTIATNVVTIIDDDDPSTGRLAITGTDPVGLDARTVMAIEDTELVFEVSRLGGSSGRVGVSVITSSAAVRLSTNRVVWTDCNRNVGRSPRQYVSLAVPPRDRLGEAGCFTVTLIPDKGVPFESGAMSFAVYVLSEDGAFAYGKNPERVETNQRGQVDLSVPCAFKPSEGTVFSIERTSGRLPVGVDVAVDSATGEITASGVITASGSFETTYRVTATAADGSVRLGLPVRFVFESHALAELIPSFAEARTFRGVPVVSEGVSAGQADVSLPRSGRGSVRFRGVGGTKSFKIDAWEYDAGSRSVSGGEERQGSSVRVVVAESGAVSLTLDFPSVFAKPVEFVLPEATPWSESRSAESWRGLYTVAFPADTNMAPIGVLACTGTPVLSLRLEGDTAVFTGTAKYAGVLPNGRSFSGSATLLKRENETFVRLPVLAFAASDVFAADLRILPDGKASALETRQMVHAADGVRACWWHTTMRDGAFVAFYGAYGSWYDPEENWEVRWMEDYFTSELPFSAAGVNLATVRAEGRSVTVEAGGPYPVEFALDASTGHISGFFTYNNTEYRWRGVFLPGWAEGCDDCGKESPERGVVLPFAMGSAWRVSENSREGCEIRIGR